MQIIILLVTFLNLNILIQSFHLNQELLFSRYGYSNESVIIDLNNQNIDSIDSDTFNDLNQLETLYLHENKLTKLDSDLFSSLLNLKVVWLESNNIVSLNRNIFANLTQLEMVCLHNNPVSILFASSIKDICKTNPNCILKVTESCAPPKFTRI